ncbi:MAG: polymerase IV protein [Candidatus Curtissbacteria bacterium GW2011_GWC2_38_9]|uniref:UmuC domain-containing protein n=3 Tax=Candidatus Curtissiibacteriota TaxID=1752717 RepID=A0A1F5HQJ4_9BACT|nr:MAG: polymerase IV protein [Candidatus Curtissbacteria bacterium GW2011_GWC2_38_9]KKS05118.1 MAG: polymerase IV protein [Candidatus Curtissbacteria bacterium GW2011_GWA2_41_24]OGE06219.1 MAG: hypothetical protein A2W70_03645 [Candidatus Curtissbacteria bacterium RIFCSPLOWO2_02_41_11]
MPKRIILHVDLNSFFATAEQQTNPSLRGKPVGILKAIGRTCVIAASVEAKKYGVKTGMAAFEAKKLCSAIILLPADFDKYADITYRFINICKTYSPTCEVFSLDECFIDISETEKFFNGALACAFEIKDRLKSEIGDFMTCSIGISHNRLLAKLASSQIKPDGLFTITEDNALEILDQSDLLDVCGLGFGLYTHLVGLGIDNFPKLRLCSLYFLNKHFGSYWSLHLYNVSRGIDNSPVMPLAEIPDAKSVSRTYTTHRLLTKKEEILKLMRNLCEETANKARQMNLCGRYVGLALRSSQKSYWGHRTLKTYIDDGKRLFDLCCQISQSWPIDHVRFCGVTLGMLTKNQYLPIPLLPSDKRQLDLMSTIDRINKRFGDYTIFPAQLLGMDIVRPEVNGYFGDRKFRLNFLRNN